MKLTFNLMEDLMNYIRVNLDGTEIMFLDTDRDRIAYWDNKNSAHIRDISNIVREMWEKQKEVDKND